MKYYANEGQDYYGFPIGIIVMQCHIPFPPGSPNNPSTFDFPVLYSKVSGATMDTLIYDPQFDTLKDQFIGAGRELVQQGVEAIFGGCGFMVLFQREMAQALPVPVFSSSLLQLPIISQSLSPEQSIGIITASGSSLTDRHMEIALNGADVSYVIGGLETRPAFKSAVHDQAGVLDSDAVQAEVVQEALDLQRENPKLGAILLECTDLPPYAAAVQQATGLPVYDITTLIQWGYSAIRPRVFNH